MIHRETGRAVIIDFNVSKMAGGNTSPTIGSTASPSKTNRADDGGNVEELKLSHEMSDSPLLKKGDAPFGAKDNIDRDGSLVMYTK